jgi:hypothetical protein
MIEIIDEINEIIPIVRIILTGETDMHNANVTNERIRTRARIKSFPANEANATAIEVKITDTEKANADITKR